MDNFEDKYNALKNEYDCVRTSWFFLSNEEEKISLVLNDIAEKIDVELPNTYYKQFEAINILMDYFRAKLNIAELSEETKKDLKELDYYKD